MSATDAAKIATAWPTVVGGGVGLIYGATWLYWWWRAHRIGSNASADVTVSVTSWQIAIAMLIGPSVAFLLLWIILRSAGLSDQGHR